MKHRGAKVEDTEASESREIQATKTEGAQTYTARGSGHKVREKEQQAQGGSLCVRSRRGLPAGWREPTKWRSVCRGPPRDALMGTVNQQHALHASRHTKRPVGWKELRAEPAPLKTAKRATPPTDASYRALTRRTGDVPLHRSQKTAPQGCLLCVEAPQAAPHRRSFAGPNDDKTHRASRHQGTHSK